MSSIEKLSKKFWPGVLLEIPQPPDELYLEGDLPNDTYTYLTVVGSRRYTSYGKEVCEKLISGLHGHPVAIISGLAIGIDTIAHRAALNAGLPTIAIPGSGLDRTVIHPSSNSKLADEIVESGGALLSEYPPFMPAGLHTFPRRNRIMAGLGKTTLVIEAGKQSGTLITARMALDYNQNVCAVPGSIFSPHSEGTHYLIREGATPVTSSSELLEALGFVINASPQGTLALDKLSPHEKKLVEALNEPLSRDELIEILEMPTNEANVLIGTMEIKGIIRESMGEIRVMR